MAKVFRLHNAGTLALSGWGVSTQYNSTIINSIADPAGAIATREITSIPSPFARMDLVKEAFAFVCREGLVGDTIHHKMVSHALDVAQIFFNYDNLKNAGLVDIVKWDVSEINALVASPDYHHKLLGRSLALFLKSDRQQFNFQLMRGLYMIRYVGPGAPNPLSIIGSTSPASLFYTSANNHDYLRGHIIFGNHQPLASYNFEALKDRKDENFIVWFYALKNAIPGFSALCPEVDHYLNLTFGSLSHELQTRINALSSTSLATDYLPLDVTPGVPVEVLGVQIGVNAPVNIGATSDFAIDSVKVTDSELPLVLPSEPFARQWRYVTAQWQSSIKVPLNPGPIEQRVLPADGARYPYLTMRDFLEDFIVQTDSRPNSDDFFDGNLSDHTGGDHSFLLPIKKEYFKYFSAADLRKAISMVCENAPGGGLLVKVTLKIPVKKGEITFERLYISDSSVMNPKNGRIINHDFTVVMFPRTKFNAGVIPDYVVGIMSKSEEWRPSFIVLDADGSPINPQLGPSDRNMDAVGNRVNMAAPIMPFASFRENFDAIELCQGNVCGIALPNWKGIAGGDVYEFAVDFGTSNTHIEYRTAGSNKSYPLDINDAARQLATFNEDALLDPIFSVAVKNNCIPYILGHKSAIDNTEVHFPMRTLLSYKKATNWSTPTAPYITGSIPFYFGDVATPSYNDIKSDLKWSSDPNITAMVECYLGSLMMIIRNKVVQEGGDLSQTKIRWFYPTSMPAATVANISDIWSRLYKSFIGGNPQNLETMPESVAPYQYYQHAFGAGVDVLTVDIGGGTSDAYIVDSNGEGAFITSFRFAANSLIGDGFVAAGLPTNGFVSKYRPIFNNVLSANNLDNVLAILEEVASAGVSSDYISTLFALKDNSDLIATQCSDKVDFIRLLQASEGAKTLVLIFYSAIIYHLANFIKAKSEEGANIQEPSVLAFSGNGSKLLQVLGVSSSVGRQMLADYTMKLFEKVMGRKYSHSTLNIVIDPDSPKESTCKGGLLAKNIPTITQIRTMTDTLLGTSPSDFIRDKKYKEINDEDWKGLSNSIEDFTDTFFSLAREFNIQANFGTVSMSVLENNRKYFASDVKLRTSNALTFMKLLGSPAQIEDTLFFYPITELLTTLARKLL